MKTLNKISLAILYKLDSNKKGLVYRAVRRVFDFSYNKAYGFSPYDYSREWRD